MIVKIKNNVFQCKVAVTTQAVQNGMMGKNFNHTFNGMLFMMPESTEQSFWMYNCIIPLDIIMIDNGAISEVHSNCSPCTQKSNCKSYTGYGREVLEVAGGTCEKLGIKKGDQVSFSLVWFTFLYFLF